MELLKTALYQQHVRHKAKILPFAGFAMPIQYTTVKQEALAVRQSAGIFDISHMGEFMIKGEEAVEFVDYLITNDMQKKGMGKAVYSPLCREDGTIIDDLIAYRISSRKILLCVNAANIKKDYHWISQHKKNFNCQLMDCSDDYSLLAIQGPSSVGILQSMNLLDKEELPRFSTKVVNKKREELIIARTGYTGEDGFEIFCSHAAAVDLWNDFLDKKVIPCGLASRDVLRLEACYPLYGHELNDHVTPLDTGLAWTVQFDKKKFMGKEALVDYTPHLRLIKLSIDKGIPRKDYKVLNQKEEIVGKVTSGTMGITLDGKGIALASIEREKFPEDRKFFIEIRKKLYPAQFHTKPFISGGR